MSDAALDNESNVSTTSSASSKRGAGYEVYDPLGQKIGSAEEVFVNQNEEPEYVRVRIGFFGQKSVLIPVQFAEVQAVTFGQALVILLIGGPLAALLASWPIALGQGLRALAEVAEYVRGQQSRVR